MNCLQCGREFFPTKGSSGRFCSLKCWYVWPGKVPTKICPMCQNSFRPKHSKQINCSRACADKSRRTARVNEFCLWCSKPLTSRFKDSKYCSHSCAQRNNTRLGQLVRPDGFVSKAGSGYTKTKVGSKWVLTHRFVMSQLLGRPIEDHERVHHRNGNRSDNRPENLELWKVKKKDPAGVRASDYHCPGCRCFE